MKKNFKNKLFITTFINVGLISALSSVLMAQTLPSKADHETMMFQIIQEEFAFDVKSINQAKIIKSANGLFQGLEIELKPKFAEQFYQLTGKYIGKRVSIFFNNKVIAMPTLQSQLSGRLLITGVTQDDANLFLQSLDNKKKQVEQSRNVPTVFKEMNQIPQLIH